MATFFDFWCQNGAQKLLKMLFFRGSVSYAFFGPLFNDFGSIFGGSEPQKVGFRMRGLLFFQKIDVFKKMMEKDSMLMKKHPKINKNPLKSGFVNELFFDVVF